MQLANDLRHALDPATWARDALGFQCDDWQADVMSATGNLLLNCSRQVGKSTVAALLALHRSLYRPGLTLLVSPSLRQSSELFRKFRDFLDGVHGRPALVEDNRLSCVLENGARVLSLPGSEATIRGFSSVSLLIVDEGAYVSDAMYYSVRPMLAVSAGALVALSTPHGKKGWFYEAWTTGENWRRFEIPATECKRISPAFLTEEKRAMGDRWFEQEYLCQFTETEDAVFSYDSVVNAVSDNIQPLWG